LGYYQELLQGRKSGMRNDTVENRIHGSGIGFRAEEAEAAIKTSLNGKSPGRGRILVELLKKMLWRKRESLMLILNKAEQERNIPDEGKFVYHFRILERNTKWFFKIMKV
jgi:hypothetical protein